MPTVRRAEPRDAAAALALIAELGRPPVGEDPEPQRQIFLDHLAFDDALVLVAEEDGLVAGIASLWIRPRLNWLSPEGWIADLYVDRDHRRQGLATALLDSCVREARRRGCHRLVLECAHNRSEARAFHQAHGFAAVGGYRFELLLGQ